MKFIDKNGVETYTEFNIFCRTVVELVADGLEKVEQYRKRIKPVISVLKFLANIFTVGMWAFATIIIMLAAGTVAYILEMSALVVAAPWLAAALLAVSGMTIYTLRSEREIAFAVNEIVKQGYEERFIDLRNTLVDTGNISDHYYREMDSLIEEATKDLAKIIANKLNIDFGMLIRTILDLDFFD